MQKDFDNWTAIKKESHGKEGRTLFKERDVWWCKLGVNIGDEQDGKGEFFLRPVLVIRKFNKRVFIGLPFSTIVKDNNPFYHKFEFKGRTQSVILAQIRLLDARRLEDRMGKVSDSDFDEIKEKSRKLIFNF